MKKMSLLLLCFVFASAAHARLTCDELEELAADLDSLATGLESVDTIGVDSELDDVLGDVSSALHVVARIEKDTELSAWIDDLDLAWEEMERDDFESSLDDIIERLDDLGERDCSDW